MKIFMNKRVISVVAAIAAIMTFSSCSSKSDGQSTSASGDKVDVAADLPSLDELYKGYESKPPAEGPPVAEGKKVALISCGEEFALCAVMGKEMTKAADVLGWDFKVYDGAGNIGGGFATAIRQ